MANDKLQLDIITLEKSVYSGEVDQVSIPTKMGEVTILPNHIPLVGALGMGELKAKIGNDFVSMAIYGGFAEINGNKVIVMADTAELADELSEEKIEKARKKVEETIKQYPEDSDEYEILSQRLEAELAKLKMFKSLRNKKNK